MKYCEAQPGVERCHRALLKPYETIQQLGQLVDRDRGGGQTCAYSEPGDLLQVILTQHCLLGLSARGCSWPESHTERLEADLILDVHGMTASASCMAQPLAERKLRLLCLHGYMQNAEVCTRLLSVLGRHAGIVLQGHQTLLTAGVPRASGLTTQSAEKPSRVCLCGRPARSHGPRWHARC